MENRGKKFEKNFEMNWKNSFPNTLVFRIQDQQSGYAGSTNPCDFICFPNNGKLYMIEVKSTHKNTFSIAKRYDTDKGKYVYDFRQYPELVEYCKYENVVVGVVIWYEDHDKIIFVPIQEVTKMMNDGLKSINVKMIEDSLYNIVEIPSKKKRVYLESDYSVLKNL